MNQNPISQDDPRLTLYALGEMEPAERAEFEQLLQQDAAARQAVAEIRAMAATVTSALESEPIATETGADSYPVPKPGKVLRFPHLYFMVSGLAAACFALFFTYWQQNRPSHPVRTYQEVDLAQVPEGQAQAPGKELERPVLAAAPTGAKAAEAGPRGLTLESTVSAQAPREVAADSMFKLEMPAAPAAPSGGTDQFHVAGQITPALKPNESLTVADGNGSAAHAVSAWRLKAGAPVVAGAGAAQAFGTKAGSSSTSQSVLARVRSAAGNDDAYNLATTWAPGPQPGKVEPDHNTEAYHFRQDNAYLRVADHPLSTFSVDVDTASYANVRRFLTQGQRPPADAVRIEELVNYFPYRYAPPAGDAPFAAHLEVASAPWAPENRLVRIGIKGREVSDTQRPAANLVFLLDVSGSMNHPNKLPLVKQSLRLLVDRLRADDRVAIAVYAGASGLVLPSTPANRKSDIFEAIDRLGAAGSTNGAMGIHLAYDIAKANFVPGGVNRVILATDGDFNVGVTSEGELTRLVAEKAKSGVFLSVLGFGMGNLKDGTLEQLADKGNGNYAYIDTLAEAKKTLVEQAGGTLMTIAKDVKIQVEFNPAEVRAYRLIGYENRLLAKEDFNNDKIDAGEIGAGHTVTALYEVVPATAGVDAAAPAVDPLKYQAVSGQRSAVSQDKAESRKLKADSSVSSELLTVKIRYKEPAGDVSSKLEFPLRDAGRDFQEATPDFKFAAAVAGFGMALRESPYKGSVTLAAVADWGRAGLGDDTGGYRREFLGLVKQAEALQQ